MQIISVHSRESVKIEAGRLSGLKKKKKDLGEIGQFHFLMLSSCDKSLSLSALSKLIRHLKV